MLAKENRKTDITLVLRPIEGKKALSSIGLLDPRLFKGGNSLHAVMDTQTCLWSLHYECGIPPEAFRQRFTSYSQLMKFVIEYMKGRNIEIAEIID